jgi:hypothetical protein
VERDLEACLLDADTLPGAVVPAAFSAVAHGHAVIS